MLRCVPPGECLRNPYVGIGERWMGVLMDDNQLHSDTMAPPALSHSPPSHTHHQTLNCLCWTSLGRLFWARTRNILFHFKFPVTINILFPEIGYSQADKQISKHKFTSGEFFLCKIKSNQFRSFIS
jgi:hypothetical protein